MSYIQMFWGFFVSNVLGYGGGPASIPLMQQEVVHHYHWLTNQQFADMLSLANALPGPIATKIAAYVGFYVSGWVGLIIASVATIVPSAVALVFLLKLLSRFRDSVVVKGMTLLVQPVIAILMGVLTWEIGRESFHQIGALQFLIIGVIAFWLMRLRRIHPALVIAGAFVYGGAILPLLD